MIFNSGNSVAWQDRALVLNEDGWLGQVQTDRGRGRGKARSRIENRRNRFDVV